MHAKIKNTSYILLPKEQSAFLKHISFFLENKYSIDYAIESIELLFSAKRVYIAKFIAEQIYLGKLFSSVAKDLFAPSQTFIIEILKIGEASGELNSSMVHAVEYLDIHRQLRSKILSSMAYPIILLCATVGLILFLMIIIFPKILGIIKGMHVPLPFPTRTIIFVFNLFQYHCFLLLIIFSSTLGTIFWLYKKKLKCKVFVFNLLRRIPFISEIFRYTRETQLFFVLSMSCAQMRPHEIIRSFSKTIIDPQFNNCLNRCSASIQNGETFEQQRAELKKYMTPEFLHLLCVSEKTGNLSSVCTAICYEAKARLIQKLDSLIKIIEPILILCMASIVCYVALSLFMPLYQLSSHAQSM